MQTARVGDVVQIHDDSPRIRWRLGDIEQLNKGADGLVRSVQRTSTGRTNHPIAKLYPLEITAADRPPISSSDDTGQQPTSSNTVRPIRLAEVRGCEKTKDWINTLCAPRRMSRIAEL